MTIRARSHRSRLALITLFAISYLVYFGSATPLAAQVNVYANTTSNGIVMTQGGTLGAGTGLVSIFSLYNLWSWND
jgi:hypothetical protein